MRVPGLCGSWPSTVTSFFPSRKRHCDRCCQREITIGKKGKTRQVTEYYHRGVVAHLVGFHLPVVLDVEMIEPGEGEIVAARRLTERLMGRYGRFFDAIQGDALYWEMPLFALCRKHGKHLLAVLKDNNPAFLADAKALLTGEPDLVRIAENGRHIRYWDQEGFTTDSIQSPLRVLRTEETWTQRERVAGRWTQSQRVSTWFWATSIPQHLIPSDQLCQVGHERWKIENSIFNTLSQHWGLDHCFHHQPTAILNFLLILFIAHILLTCFHRLNMKEAARRIYSTLIAVARAIHDGVRDVRAKNIPWRQTRGSPKTKA